MKIDVHPRASVQPQYAWKAELSPTAGFVGYGRTREEALADLCRLLPDNILWKLFQTTQEGLTE